MSSFGGVTIPFARWREACQRQKLGNGREVLQQEAKKLFCSLFLTTTVRLGGENDDNGFSLTTKPAHQQALAQLLRELGPCFTVTATHMSRLWALHCLVGAVDGCQEISPIVMNLMGSFLLTNCDPLEQEEDYDGEQVDELVRDAAVLCLTALVKSVVKVDPEDQTMETDSIAKQRLHLAQAGVERRCATPDQMDSIDHAYDSVQFIQDVRGGLSRLPRSRRALCFDLIRASIDGIAKMPRLSDSSDKLASFASFCANCLHGESDPRCLQQLLNTLNSLQITFSTHFESNSPHKFPTVDLFDAVAPYYPIQFTPPPNDKYGITCQGLQRALIAIMSFAGNDEPFNRSSMLNLAISVVIERIDDDNSTVQDKLDALEDLTTLLETPTNLSPESIREISHALISTHSLGAEGVATGKHGPHKALADACRSLASKLCANLEINNDLWSVFVKETLDSDASLLTTTPQSLKGRSTIAYLACFVASGGPRTLTATLNSCLPHLYDALCQPDDEEKVAAAAYGVGAFISSFNVGFRRGRNKAVSFHPHPLEPHSTKMLVLLVDLCEKSNDGGTKIAIVSAMVSLLMVTPSELLDNAMIQVVINFIKGLCALIISSKEDHESLCDTVAKSLGSIIASAMNDSEAELPSVVRDTNAVRDFIEHIVIPDLMKSCLNPSDASKPRFDVLAVARACTNSQHMAKLVLDTWLRGLERDLKIGEKLNALCDAHLVFTILNEGHANAQVAFHEAQIDPVDLMKIMGHASSDQVGPSVWNKGLSILELPSSNIEIDDETSAIEFGYEIVTRFLPAFKVPLPEKRLTSLFDYMDHILPPLSDWQRVQVNICVPLLAATVRQKHAMPEQFLRKLASATTALAEFALDSRNYPPSRSDTALSLFWIVLHQPRDAQADVCLTHHILETTVFPEIRSGLMRLKDPEVAIDGECADSFRDALNLASILGSAVACRGGNLDTKVADDVARYMLQVALIGTAQDPFDHSQTVISIPRFQIEVAMRLAAAAAYGSFISVDCSGSLGPLWKQRLMHVMHTEFNAIAVNVDCGDPSFWGQLALVAYTVACGKLSNMTESMYSMLVHTLISSLLQIYPKHVTKQLEQSLVIPDVLGLQELVLAGIIKLIGSSRSDITKYTVCLLPAMLRILSRANLAGDGSMSLALQILCTICTFENEKEKLLRFKPAVESVLLKILDHPSSIFCQMVAETRNHWAVLC